MENGKILGVYLIICGFAPFWFRFWQCINKYYYSENRAHLLNAGKYFSKLVVPLVLLLNNGDKHTGDPNFMYYCFFQTLATLYCAGWDYYMDWGLLRSSEPGKYGLRPTLSYDPKFYYIACIVNFMLRFFWVFQIFGFHWKNQDFDIAWQNLEILTFVAMLAEAFRRAQWSLIRVENEFHNNFEQYRSIP
jgi:hypothetical protein